MDYYTVTYFHIFYIPDRYETYARVLAYRINACYTRIRPGRIFRPTYFMLDLYFHPI